MKVRFHVPMTHRELMLESVILLKVGIMAGMLAAYFMPSDHAIWVGITTNLLWLWKL